MLKRVVLAVAVLLLAGSYAWAGELKLPRFAALKADEVNMRAGPGDNYPIKWVYRRKHMPVEIIDEKESWRKIKDVDGETGWIARVMLDGKRYGIIKGNLEPAYKRPDAKRLQMRLEKGALVKLNSCSSQWCEVETQDMSGWVKKSKLYGIYAREEF